MSKLYTLIFALSIFCIPFTAQSNDVSLDVWLGIVVEDIDTEMANTMGLESENGVFVAFTVPFGSADKQGLLIGDIIRNIDGKTIHGISDLKTVLCKKKPQETSQIEILREGSIKSVKILWAKTNTSAKEGFKPTSGQAVF